MHQIQVQFLDGTNDILFGGYEVTETFLRVNEHNQGREFTGKIYIPLVSIKWFKVKD